jgi:4-hydroxy-4-methyl-2-oxoglutarate aldolase
MTNDLCERLAAFDTPTIANVVETFAARDLTEGYAGMDVSCHTATRRPMVGYAVTLTFDSTTGGAPRPSRWFEMIELLQMAPTPSVVVSQYIGSDRRRGCWIGDIVATLLHRLGAVGTVTDTGIRDIATIRERLPDFSVFAAGLVPSHGNGAVIDIGIPVSISGMLVRPGDIVHGDGNGLVTVPNLIAAQVADRAAEAVDEEARLVELLRRDPFPLNDVRERFRH